MVSDLLAYHLSLPRINRLFSIFGCWFDCSDKLVLYIIILGLRIGDFTIDLSVLAQVSIVFVVHGISFHCSMNMNESHGFG